MKFKKHLGLISQSLKMKIMDRMDVAFSFVIITIGVFAQFALTVIFFKVIYLKAGAIGGWNINQIYILLGTHTLIQNLAWATYIRGFLRLGRFIEQGDLDLLLSRPINLRSYFIYAYNDSIFVLPQILIAVGMIVYGAMNIDQLNILAFLFFLVCAIILHFSLVVIFATVNFFFIIRQNMALQGAIYNLGKYPMTIYTGATRLILSIVIPLLFIYSVPAMALFGEVSLKNTVGMICITVVFYFFSKWFWGYGLSRHESAQG